MKRRIRFALLAASAALLALSSCNQEEGRPQEGDRADFTIEVMGSLMTRSTGNTGENEGKVNNLQVLVFDDHGIMETYKSADGVTAMNLTSTSGPKTIWAVVNAPSLSAATSLNDINGTVSDLTDNALDSYVMTGSLQSEITNGAVISIHVKRMASKVILKKITTAFPDTPAYAGKTLSVSALYLINVAKTVNFSLAGAPTAWFNKLGHYDTEGDYFLYDQVGQTLANGESYSVVHDFYPYPNNVTTSVKEIAADQRGTWSPRRTILVIEATVGDVSGYYPIELPVLERNTKYEIDEVVITRTPGPYPYDPIETGEASVSITIDDWDLVTIGTITI